MAGTWWSRAWSTVSAFRRRPCTFHAFPPAMSPELAIDIFKGVIIFSLYIVAPFLVVMLVI